MGCGFVPSGNVLQVGWENTADDIDNTNITKQNKKLNMITLDVFCDYEFDIATGIHGPISERTSQITINENMIVQVSDLQVSSSRIGYYTIYMLNGSRYYISYYQLEDLHRRGYI